MKTAINTMSNTQPAALSPASYQLVVECRRKSEVLERLLRVVRHRGFALESLSVDCSACGQKVVARMAVSSSRPLELLISQVEKLYDVVQVEGRAEYMQQVMTH